MYKKFILIVLLFFLFSIGAYAACRTEDFTVTIYDPLDQQVGSSCSQTVDPYGEEDCEGESVTDSCVLSAPAEHYGWYTYSIEYIEGNVDHGQFYFADEDDCEECCHEANDTYTWTGMVCCGKETRPCICSIGDTLCKDGSCEPSCASFGGYPDPIPGGGCQVAEGCTSPDCSNKTEPCVPGAVCDPVTKSCKCSPGTTFCSDNTCSADCGANFFCQPDDECRPEDKESCSCPDCYNRFDSCVTGAVCFEQTNTCEYDTDVDGVPDPIDDCADTPPNTVVDSHGCPYWGVVCPIGQTKCADDVCRPECTGATCDAGDQCMIGCNPPDSDCGGATSTCGAGDGCYGYCETPDPDCDGITCDVGDGCLDGCNPKDPDCRIATCYAGDTCVLGCPTVDPDCGGGTCEQGDGCAGGQCNPPDHDCDGITCNAGDGCLDGCDPVDADCSGATCDAGDKCMVGCLTVDPDCRLGTCAAGDGCAPNCQDPDPDCTGATCEFGDACIAGCNPVDPDCEEFGCGSDGFCRVGCDTLDPDCGSGLSCNAGDGCLATCDPIDPDCGALTCATGDGCLAYCTIPDPDCGAIDFCNNNYKCEPELLEGCGCTDCDILKDSCSQDTGKALCDYKITKQCQLDPDNDGIPGEYPGGRDECPDTPFGENVDSKGCTLVVELCDPGYALCDDGECHEGGCNAALNCDGECGNGVGDSCLCPECEGEKAICGELGLCVSGECQTCELNSLAWAKSCATEGENALININGTAGCVGKQLNLTIVEDDEDYLHSFLVNFASQSLTALWSAEWVNDGPLQGDPEYEIEARIKTNLLTPSQGSLINVIPCNKDFDQDCDGYCDAGVSEDKPGCTAIAGGDQCPDTPICDGVSVDSKGCTGVQTSCVAEWDCTGVEWTECDSQNKQTRDIGQCKSPGAGSSCYGTGLEPASVRTCILEEEFPFFSIFNVVLVLFILIGYYFWTNRNSSKKAKKR